MEITALSTKDTQELAQQIAQKLLPGDIILLEGELGAGKTTFVRYLADALGFTNRVQSPTFVLVRQYLNHSGTNPIKRIHHLDLYRLTSAEELSDLGLEEYFNDEVALTVIEWPNIAADTLPSKVITIKIDILGEEERKFYVHNIR